MRITLAADGPPCSQIELVTSKVSPGWVDNGIIVGVPGLASKDFE